MSPTTAGTRATADDVWEVLSTARSPRGRHGPVRRRPVADVVAQDRWEQPFFDEAATP